MDATTHATPIIREATPADFQALAELTELGFATGPYGRLPRRRVFGLLAFTIDVEPATRPLLDVMTLEIPSP